MAFVGLASANNLSDVASAELAWDNLGESISYTINNVTTSGVVIKGADILALNGVSRISARDLLLLNGLTSNAQVRLNTISQQIASGIILQDNALLKASPISAGNYSLSGNLVFSSARINGIAARSLSTTPFASGVATTSIYLDKVIIASGFTVRNTTTSGSVASPELAIPIEDNGYIYYIKAGQS
jgi:hypothetical protein